jgi:hypothetical protein
VASSTDLLRSVVPVVHPVIACDLLILGVGQTAMNTRQDRVVGTMLAQFINETRPLCKGTGGVGIHGVLRVRIFDGPRNWTHRPMMPDYYATRKAHPPYAHSSARSRSARADREGEPRPHSDEPRAGSATQPPARCAVSLQVIVAISH